MGFRAIQRIMGVHHTTIIKWVKELGKKAEKEYNEDRGQEIPEITQIDELQTFIGKKKQNLDLEQSLEKKPSLIYKSQAITDNSCNEAWLFFLMTSQGRQQISINQEF